MVESSLDKKKLSHRSAVAEEDGAPASLREFPPAGRLHYSATNSATTEIPQEKRRELCFLVDNKGLLFVLFFFPSEL